MIVGYYKGLTATKTFYRIWNFLQLFLSTLHQIFLQEFKELKEGHALAIGHDHDESSRTLSTQNSPETQSAGQKSCNVEKEHMLYAKLLLLCNQQITLQQQQQQTSLSYVLPLEVCKPPSLTRHSAPQSSSRSLPSKEGKILLD